MIRPQIDLIVPLIAQACFGLWTFAFALLSIWNILHSDLPYQVSTQENFFQDVFPQCDSCKWRPRPHLAREPRLAVPSLCTTLLRQSIPIDPKWPSLFSHLVSLPSCFAHWDRLPNESLASNSLFQALLLLQAKHEDQIIFDLVPHDPIPCSHSTSSYLTLLLSNLFTCLSLHCQPTWSSIYSQPSPPTRCLIEYKHGDMTLLVPFTAGSPRLRTPPGTR